MTSLERVLIVGAMMPLAACSATVRQTPLAGGAQGYAIDCSGIQRTRADCDSKAHEVCPAGYDVVFSISAEKNAPVPYRYQREITVRCKP